jgi:hypothetical protein
MPLQNSSKKEDKPSASKQNLSARSLSRTKRNNSSKNRRVDVSAYSSPIAKDQAGKLYYMKAVDEFVVGPSSFDDRNANTLFSSNRSMHQHV